MYGLRINVCAIHHTGLLAVKYKILTETFSMFTPYSVYIYRGFNNVRSIHR